MVDSEARLGWNQDPIAFEGRPEVPVEDVEIQATHRGGCACSLCGGRMENVFSTHEIWGATLIYRTENMPEYYCYEDDYAKPDLLAWIEFQEGALERLTATGDKERAVDLGWEISAAKRLQEMYPDIL
jgi:hypothetical protein